MAQMVLVLMLLILCSERIQRRSVAIMTKTPPHRRTPIISFLCIVRLNWFIVFALVYLPAQCESHFS